MPLNINIQPSKYTADMHVLNAYLDGEFLGRQLLSMDEIETLELNLTDVLAKLYKYRHTQECKE